MNVNDIRRSGIWRNGIRYSDVSAKWLHADPIAAIILLRLFVVKPVRSALETHEVFCLIADSETARLQTGRQNF